MDGRELGTRTNQMGAREAEAAGAPIMFAAYPLCYPMLSNGAKELELSEKLQVIDIARPVVKAADLDGQVLPFMNAVADFDRMR